MTDRAALKKWNFLFNIRLRMPKSQIGLVLYSGGIDSTTALYWARTCYERVSALSFDYGQRHRIELKLARRLTRRLGISHHILAVDLRPVGGSALTDSSLSLPTFERTEEIEPSIPVTYVPFRNGIFLALAAAWAEPRGIRDIVCGFNIIDSPNYPDTRPVFIRAMEKAIRQGTAVRSKGRMVRILAPFVQMKKTEIIQTGLGLGADYSSSISCYRGREIPCRKCSSCLLRQRAWKEVGIKDPLIQRLEKEGRL
jgi:7-cyano-7-deazaguanine synthase